MRNSSLIFIVQLIDAPLPKANQDDVRIPRGSAPPPSYDSIFGPSLSHNANSTISTPNVPIKRSSFTNIPTYSSQATAADSSSDATQRRVETLIDTMRFSKPPTTSIPSSVPVTGTPSAKSTDNKGKRVRTGHKITTSTEPSCPKANLPQVNLPKVNSVQGSKAPPQPSTSICSRPIPAQTSPILPREPTTGTLVPLGESWPIVLA